MSELEQQVLTPLLSILAAACFLHTVLGLRCLDADTEVALLLSSLFVMLWQ